MWRSRSAPINKRTASGKGHWARLRDDNGVWIVRAGLDEINDAELDVGVCCEYQFDVFMARRWFATS